MSAIAYHRPSSLGEAAKLAESDPEARILAGGQSVLPSMKLGLLAPSAFIDLAALGELRGIRANRQSVTIGAMTTHAAVAESAPIVAAIPSLAQLASGIGDPQVRNRGTIGGSLANSDPAADYPAAVLALNATIRTNRRALPADGFFKGLFETALLPGEIITAVEFPVPNRAAYVKFHQPASRFALVGVFVAQTSTGVRVAVTGAGACAFRAKALEDALGRRFAPQACEGISIPPENLNTDIHASAEYRAHLIPVLARRAVG
ncbi:MAG TPA: xanthine dehydrogenase family protein subunit M [Steroidobacteraceae bacterium]|jgi:carbon-monoxide dehydrogenase medium subunit|nr:xanthine dehydrogenase family protein subunit M [Steroidobacteraceae bacterium]